MKYYDTKRFFEIMDDRAGNQLEHGDHTNHMLYAIGCMLRSIAYSQAVLIDAICALSSDESDEQEDPDGED